MKRMILAISMLFILSLACGTVTDATDLPDMDQVATVVAATLGAPNDPIATEPSPTDPLPTEIANNPVGLRIAYIRDDNIWLWEEGLATRQLTNLGPVVNVRISDDGQIVAFTRQGELWAIPADGGDPIQMVSQAYLAAVPRDNDYEGTPKLESYEFIPGTHTLFFDIFLDTDMYPVPYHDLHRVDADNPAPEQVLLIGQNGDRYYSPDKQWVALSQPGSIAIMRANGSDYQIVFNFDAIMTYSEWSFKPEVVWKSASDGFYLALPPVDFLGNPNELGRFWYIGLDGAVAQLATFRTGSVSPDAPQISPDGSKVLYVKDVGDGREIHIVDASTADLLFIASADSMIGLLGWADSDHFGFWYRDIDKPWYATVADHSQRVLTDIYPTQSYSIRWLKDGRVIFKAGQELRLTTPGSPSVVIDAPIIFLDFDVAE